ncbi:MAG: Unknown protein [uncultured Sulfurovum sp.]|uniref:Fibronectin type-III domain-containing protein n=1 Tax=uncultured Sulfurovum sp. TaxID=269237 RepID=A0A6S6TJ84_9BACT|nr:MAG: Unknown protein [uncultured Sulfurovum sp.]
MTKTPFMPNLLKTVGASILFSGMAIAAAPSAPGAYVGIYNVTDTTARVSFTDTSTDEEGFKIYIHDENDVLDATLPVNPVVVPANDTPSPFQYKTLTDLSAHTIYKLHVTAFNADGESVATIPSSVNNGVIRTSPPVCQPAMPGEYVGTYNITNTSARISFIDNSNNEDGFRIRVYNAGTNALVKTMDVDPIAGTGNFQYANITGLTVDTIYKVVVTAFASGCGESDPTHPSSVNNGTFKTTNEPCPLMPGGYVGTYNTTSSGSRISFIDNADNETGFKVYVYKGTGTGSTLVKTLTLPAVTGIGGYRYANITGLDTNTLYSVKVSAFNASCESAMTMPSSANNGWFTTLP